MSKALFYGPPKKPEVDVIANIERRRAVMRVYNRKEEEMVKELAQDLMVRNVAAKDLLNDSKQAWTKFLVQLKNFSEYKNAKIVNSIQDKILSLIEKNDLGNARYAAYALGIIYDKIFLSRSAKGGPDITLKGKNIQVNLAWKFKPYKPSKGAAPVMTIKREADQLPEAPRS